MDNGWEKYQMLVLKELKDFENKINSIDDKIEKMLIVIERLKIKTSLLAGFFGIIGGAIAIIIQYILKKL